MMDREAFKKAYNESRTGANEFYKHSMRSKFHYSDGVRDCALAGCYWLLDIAATEFPEIMRKNQEQHAILEVRVDESQTARLALTVDDDKPPIWSRIIQYTDMPKGDWFFELADETARVAMILLSEH